jgi:hypothetical protein
MNPLLLRGSHFHHGIGTFEIIAEEQSILQIFNGSQIIIAYIRKECCMVIEGFDFFV